MLDLMQVALTPLVNMDEIIITRGAVEEEGDLTGIDAEVLETEVEGEDRVILKLRILSKRV